MVIIEEKEYVLMESIWFSFAHSHDFKVIGICILDKYCWTNIFGYEKLVDYDS